MTIKRIAWFTVVAVCTLVTLAVVVFFITATRTNLSNLSTPSNLTPVEQAQVNADPSLLHCEDNGGTLHSYDHTLILCEGV